MTSVSSGHIILTPNQPIGSGQPQRRSNPGPPHQESRALPTEPPRPLHRFEYMTVLDFHTLKKKKQTPSSISTEWQLSYFALHFLIVISYHSIVQAFGISLNSVLVVFWNGHRYLGNHIHAFQRIWIFYQVEVTEQDHYPHHVQSVKYSGDLVRLNERWCNRQLVNWGEKTVYN